MLKVVAFLFLFSSIITFAQEEREIMYRIVDSEEWDSCGYVNKNGDTLIPFGDCITCFSDSLNYAIVIKWEDNDGPGFLTIDSKGNEIFRVFAYDNGPDYIKDGTMRIIKNGKIGYASQTGEIIIEPKYEAARPFKNGRAQVSLSATKVQEGEHWRWTNTDWFYIDKNGKRHKNQEE